MDIIIALLPMTEITVICLGIFVWLRGKVNPYPVAAALALGIVSGLGILSLCLQIGFLLRRPDVAGLLELIVLGAVIGLNWQRWHVLQDIWQRLHAIWQEKPIAVTVIAIAITYLFLLAVLLPPSSWDALTYHLPRVLLWAQNRSLFLQDFIISPQVAFPVGSDILFHLFLRFQTDYGLGLFSWLSYLVILLATYAIACPRVNREIAFTTTLVIIALPEIVYQSTATKNDIILTAVALACVLWADQWLRSPAIESLLGLGLTLCLGIAVKTSFVLFAFFFLLLWFTLVIQQGRWWTLAQLLVKYWHLVLLSLLPALILSQCWLFFENHRQFGEWLGPAKFGINSRNHDGLWGGLANVVRYSFQSIHLLRPINDLWEWLTGWSLTSGLQATYDSIFAPWFGEAGRSQIGSERPFQIEWNPQEDTSWFGPFGIFLIVPAIVWGTFRGRELTRVMAIVAICLVLAISYKIGWSPWKSRFFSMVFASGGLCVAMLLQRLQVGRWRLFGLQMLSLSILCYACLCNVQKPLILQQSLIQPTPHLPSINIWSLSDWTHDRLIYDRLYAGNRVALFSQSVPAGQQVAIVGYDHYFPFMFHNPDLEYVLLSTETTPDGTAHSLVEIEDRLVQMDYLMCFLLPCHPSNLTISLEPVWKTDIGSKVTELYKVLP